MTFTLQQRISNLHPRAARTVLTLAVVLVFGVLSAPGAHAQKFTDLYNFTGGHDGGNSYSGLVRDSQGNLYGTTYWGGTFGWGTVFKVDTKGTETVLYSFCSAGGSCPDGVNPDASLIRDGSGNLYGTTYDGGAFNWGTVFKVDTTGSEKVLYSFAGGVADGCTPSEGLVVDKAGNFYGVAGGCGSAGHGVIFKLSPSGQETLLHTFTGGTSDGSNPVYGSLLIDGLGNLYGVAQEGGASGQGVVYKLSKGGTFTVLHSFAGGTADGCFPLGSVAADKNGNLYGTTSYCGSSNNGTIWKLSPTGKETVLHSFAGGTTDGELPQAGVILDPKGNLYGAAGGGANGRGLVYELNTLGKLILLHSFTGSDGEVPYGGLLGVIVGGKGALYGTTEAGGAGYGSVWSVSQ